MINRNKVAILIMILVLAVAMAGCGQKTQPTQQAPGPAPTVQSEKAASTPALAPPPAKESAPVDKPLKKINMSYSAVSMSWLPIRVAIDKGFFRDEGLDPQMIQMKGNVATTALVTGDTEFTVNISPVLNGANQGLGLKLVVGLNTRPLFSLMVRPEIKTKEDLKGKVFGVSSFGNTQAILTEKHLQSLGLKESEYKLIALGETGARLAAMEQNAIQGSLMPPPANVKMENQGYFMMGNTAEVVIQPVVGLGTNEKNIKEQREMIKGSIKAALRGLQFVHGNKAETIKVIMEWVDVNEKDASRAYDLSKEGFGKNGSVSEEDLSIEWNLIQAETKKTDVPVSAAYDFSILREVQQELGIK